MLADEGDKGRQIIKSATAVTDLMDSRVHQIITHF